MKKVIESSLPVGPLTFLSKNPSLRAFLQGISIIFIFNLSAYVLRFVVTIYIARSWGPVEYGKIALILSLGAFLFFPVVMGQHNAMFKYLPNTGPEEHPRIISTVFLSNLIIAAVICLVYYVSYPILIKPLKITVPVWNLAIIMAIGNNYQALTESFLRGKKLFKSIGVLKIVNALVFLAIAAVVLVMGFKNSVYFVGAFAAGMVVSSISTIIYLKIKPAAPDLDFGKKSLKYGSIVMVNQLLTAVIFNGDLVVLNYFLSDKDLGLYVAYQGLIKGLFFLFFEEIFAVVFLPNIANMDRKKLFESLAKYDLLIIGAVSLLAGIALRAVLFLYGDKYVFNRIYLIITAGGIGFFTMFQVYNQVLTMEGKKGARRAFSGVLMVIPLFFALLGILTKMFSLTGAVISISSIYFLLYAVLKIVLNNHFTHKPKGDVL